MSLRTQRLVVRSVIAIALTLNVSSTCTGQHGFDVTDLQTNLSERTAGLERVVVLVGVFDGGRTRIYKGGGAGLRKIDEHTIFEIGSVTKVFTATILARMVLDGEVRLEDPIQKYLPQNVCSPTLDGRDITLLDLAEQTSGLPREGDFDPMDPNAAAVYTTDKVYDLLGRIKLLSRPGDRYLYSNFGVALLGDLLARRAGMTYAQLLRTDILDPLKMHDSYVGPRPGAAARLAPPRTGDGLDAPSMDFAVGYEAAGAIRSTLHDMLLFLRANLHPPPNKLGKAMLFAQEPRVSIPGKVPQKIGLLWTTQIDHSITWHNGGTFGYRSFIGFDRTAGRGVVVLSNSVVSVDDIGFHVLAPERPLQMPAATIRLSLSTLESYAGVYTLDDADGTKLDVSARADGLLVSTGSVQFLLRATSETTFVSNDAPGTFLFKDGGVLIEQPGQPPEHGSRH